MAQETEDIQDVVRICAKHGVPVIAFGTGTSLEGQVNAPAGGDLHRPARHEQDSWPCMPRISIA